MTQAIDDTEFVDMDETESMALEEEFAEKRSNDRRGGDKDRRDCQGRRQGDDQFDASDRRTGMDRRSGWDRRRGPGRRRSNDRRAAEEGEMTDDQFEFLRAIEEYKRVNRRPFPSYTEVMEILKALGYRKVAEAKPLNPSQEEESHE